MTNAGTADYTIAGTSYWTDDQIEDHLDVTQKNVNYQPMHAVPTYGIGGAVTYTEYQTGMRNWEKSPIVQDEGGTTLTAGTSTGNYAFDDVTGVVDFVGDTEGKTRYITGYVYNPEQAASAIWAEKASQTAALFDFSTDNHSIKRSQMRESYLEMARFYKNKAGVGMVRLVRSDDISERNGAER